MPSTTDLKPATHPLLPPGMFAEPTVWGGTLALVSSRCLRKPTQSSAQNASGYTRVPASSDALTLPARRDAQRTQDEHVDQLGLRVEPATTGQYVPDNRPVLLGHQRQAGAPPG